MIILLYGEDNFRSLRRLKQYREAFEKKKKGSITLFDFGWEDPKERFIDALAAGGGLFSSASLVVAKNIFSAWSRENQKTLNEFLRKEKSIWESKEHILVIWEGEKIDQRGALFKLLHKRARLEKFDSLRGAQLEKWLALEARKLNPKVTPSEEALEKLVLYVGHDLFLAYHALEKITTFKGQGTLDGEDVDLLVRSQTQAEIFETIDALCSNKGRALELIHRHLEQGDDPFYLFSMIVYQFRNLVKIAGTQWQKLAPQEIAKRTKLHPFVVGKNLPQLRVFDFAKLKAVYKKLASLDFQIKTGQIDINLALDKFVAEV